MKKIKRRCNYENGISYPACSENAISVGATYDDNFGFVTWLSCVDFDADVDEVACFTNTYTNLDLMAPGAQIISTIPGGYGLKSGTSMATPHVTGAVALLK